MSRLLQAFNPSLVALLMHLIFRVFQQLGCYYESATNSLSNLISQRLTPNRKSILLIKILRIPPLKIRFFGIAVIGEILVD